MPIFPFENSFPKIAQSVFLAPGSMVVGDVEIGEESSVWHNTVLRGDMHSIRVGKRTNIQDLSMVHVTGGAYPAIIGDEVTIGHRAIIHACTIGNRCLIGMGSIIMDGAVIGDDCIVAAGSLVTEGMQLLPGTVIYGSPAKRTRPIRDEEREWIKASVNIYAELAKKYLGQ